ncbi:hypothetical protein LXL04_017529 [Taraxacum kok-saghyz]
MYMGENRVMTTRVQILKAEFKVLNMKGTETINEVSMKVNNMVRNIRALGDTMDDIYVLPNFVQGEWLERSKLQRESRHKLLLTHQEWESRGHGRGGGRGDGKITNETIGMVDKEEHVTRDKINEQCCTCQEYGHYASE